MQTTGWVLLLLLCALFLTLLHNALTVGARRAAPTCSNGCLLVHGHGHSCAGCHYHGLAWTFWGNKNYQVTFSAPGEEPVVGWWDGEAENTL